MSTMITLNGTRAGQAELFDPVGAAKGAAIIIAYGSEGMTDDLSGPWATMIREFANTLASKGFVVVIPDYLETTSTRPGPDVFALIHTHGAHWERAIADAMAHVRTVPGIDPAKVGLLGFSLGGHLCLRLRAATKALVEFYAPAYGLSPSAGRLALNAQIHHGRDDNLVRFSPNADVINGILQREGAVTELHPYAGANHGFIGSDARNTTARKESLERTVAFFERHL